MLPVFFGIGLALVAMAAACLACAALPLSDFPTIAYACAVNGIAPDLCTRESISIGVQSIVAFALVLAAGIALERALGKGDATRVQPVHPVAMQATLIVVFAVLTGHLLALYVGPVHASRLDESDHFSNFISLENLLWPLLLQLFVQEDEWRARLMLLATLVGVMALTPFRAVQFAIVLFGFALPAAVALWRAMRAGWSRMSLRSAWPHVMALAIIGGVTVWGGYVDTKTRAPSLAVAAELTARPDWPAANPHEAQRAPAAQAPLQPAQQQTGIPGAVPANATTAPLPPVDLKARLLQRMAFPLYQATILSHLADETTLPSIKDEVARKFRWSRAPTLEEFLFRRIFGGESSGQATSLYYGEAVAYTPGPPLLWMIIAPLGLVAAAQLLRRRAIEAGTLFGLAIWRSSFSGLISILPALALQVLGLIGLIGASRLLSHRPSLVRLLSPVVSGALAVILGGALLMQAWTLLHKPVRNPVLVVSFAIAPECTLVSPTWVAIRVNQVFADHGLSISAAAIAASRNAATVGVPFAIQSETLIPDMAERIGNLVQCPAQHVAHPVTPTTTQILEWMPNPIEFLALLATAAALLACLIGLWRGVQLRVLQLSEAER